MRDSCRENNNKQLSDKCSFKYDDLFGDAFSEDSETVPGNTPTRILSPHIFHSSDANDDDLMFLKECLPSSCTFPSVSAEHSDSNAHQEEIINSNPCIPNNFEYSAPLISPQNNTPLTNPISGIFGDLSQTISTSIDYHTLTECDNDEEDEDIDVIFQGITPSQNNNSVVIEDAPSKQEPFKFDLKIPKLSFPQNSFTHGQLNIKNVANISDEFINIISRSNGVALPFANGKIIPKFPMSNSQFINNAKLNVSNRIDNSIVGEDEDDDDEADDHNKRLSTFSEYTPMKFKHGKPHPDQVVETSSMAVVEPPDISYNIQMIDEAVDAGSLSSLQLEALAYACQRHETFLESGERAAFFLGDGPGVGKGRIIAGIIHENKLQGREKSLWLSVSSDLRFDATRDLTDVQCHLKVIPLNKMSYNECVSDYEGYAEDGVLFATYSSLIGVNNNPTSIFHTRLDQIVDWCGDDFDGVLVFDECHKAKNLLPISGGKPTKTGVSVLELQKKLPNARIVYCSATGATEPKNLGYMYRLGLWGPGTPFGQLNDFIRAVEKRGVGGMEIVAMDMKLRGMYIARQLSFSGVAFRVHEVELLPSFKAMYNRSVQLWKKILLYSEKAIEMCGLTGRYSAFYWGKFWSYHQRFFKYLCIASKVMTVTELTHQALKDGKCVIIGLQSTGESHISENDCNLERIVSTASGVLTALVEKSFPIPCEVGPDEKDHKNSNEISNKKYQGCKMKRSINSIGDFDEQDEFIEVDEDVIIVDDNNFTGKQNKYDFDELKQPNNYEQEEVLAAAGLPSCKYSWGTSTKLTKKVASENLNMTPTQICERWRRELLDEIESMHNELPSNTLDELIDKLGGVDHVAEMTGRKGRIVRIRDDFYTYKLRSNEELPLEYVNVLERTKFMNGEKFVAIISEAASAGISLQADRRHANSRQRVHITLELPWSADKAVQQFGRSHRSNQLYPPEYVFVISELAGEKRFASSVAKRLESLGALTHGDRRVGESRDLSQFNYENKYGRMALHYMINCLSNGEEVSPIPPPKYVPNKDFFVDALEAMRSSGLGNLIKGIMVDSTGDGHAYPGANSTKSNTKISRFLNRILGIEVDLQNAIFSYYTSILNKIVKDQKKAGKWDSGILDWGVTGEKVVINDQTKFTIHSKNSDSVVELIQIFIERGTDWIEASNIYHSSNDDGNGFYSINQYKNQQSVILIKKLHNSSFNNLNDKKFDTDAHNQLYTIYRPNLGESAKTETLDNIAKRYTWVDESTAQLLWENQYKSSPNQCTHLFRWGKCSSFARNGLCDHGRRRKIMHVLSGAIFGIWNIIEGTFHDSHIRIVRVSTSDGYRKIGITVPPYLVETIKAKLHQEMVNSFKIKMRNQTANIL